VSSTPHEVPPPPAGSGSPQLGGATYASAPTNNLAVVSLVAGIASFFAHVIPVIGGFTVAIIAIITGFMARGQIKRTGEQGMWMANAGIVIGIIHIALGFIVLLVVLFLIFVVGLALFGIAATGGGSSPTPVPTG
jgi:predicted PurR-regulated permease PerM